MGFNLSVNNGGTVIAFVPVGGAQSSQTGKNNIVPFYRSPTTGFPARPYTPPTLVNPGRVPLSPPPTGGLLPGVSPATLPQDSTSPFWPRTAVRLEDGRTLILVQTPKGVSAFAIDADISRGIDNGYTGIPPGDMVPASSFEDPDRVGNHGWTHYAHRVPGSYSQPIGTVNLNLWQWASPWELIEAVGDSGVRSALIAELQELVNQHGGNFDKGLQAFARHFNHGCEELILANEGFFRQLINSSSQQAQKPPKITSSNVPRLLTRGELVEGQEPGAKMLRSVLESLNNSPAVLQKLSAQLKKEGDSTSMQIGSQNVLITRGSATKNGFALKITVPNGQGGQVSYAPEYNANSKKLDLPTQWSTAPSSPPPSDSFSSEPLSPVSQQPLSPATMSRLTTTGQTLLSQYSALQEQLKALEKPEAMPSLKDIRTEGEQWKSFSGQVAALRTGFDRLQEQISQAFADGKINFDQYQQLTQNLFENKLNLTQFEDRFIQAKANQYTRAIQNTEAAIKAGEPLPYGNDAKKDGSTYQKLANHAQWYTEKASKFNFSPESRQGFEKRVQEALESGNKPKPVPPVPTIQTPVTEPKVNNQDPAVREQRQLEAWRQAREEADRIIREAQNRTKLRPPTANEMQELVNSPDPLVRSMVEAFFKKGSFPGGGISFDMAWRHGGGISFDMAWRQYEQAVRDGVAWLIEKGVDPTDPAVTSQQIAEKLLAEQVQPPKAPGVYSNVWTALDATGRAQDVKRIIEGLLAERQTANQSTPEIKPPQTNIENQNPSLQRESLESRIKDFGTKLTPHDTYLWAQLTETRKRQILDSLSPQELNRLADHLQIEAKQLDPATVSWPRFSDLSTYISQQNPKLTSKELADYTNFLWQEIQAGETGAHIRADIATHRSRDDVVSELLQKRSNPDFSGWNLKGADLSGLGLQHANFTGADLRFAYLVGSNFSYSNLAGANLTGANISSTNFTGAFLMGTVFPLEPENRFMSTFSGAQLDTNFPGSDLTDMPPGVGFLGMTQEEIENRVALIRQLPKEEREKVGSPLLTLLFPNPGALPRIVNDIHSHDAPFMGFGSYDPRYVGARPPGISDEEWTVMVLSRMREQQLTGKTVIMPVAPMFPNSNSRTQNLNLDGTGTSSASYYLERDAQGQKIIGTVIFENGRAKTLNNQPLLNSNGIPVIQPFDIPIEDFEILYGKKLPKDATRLDFVVSLLGCELHFSGPEVDALVLENHAKLIRKELDLYGTNFIAENYVVGLTAGNIREPNSDRNVFEGMRLAREMEQKYGLKPGTIQVIVGEKNLSKEVVEGQAGQLPLASLDEPQLMNVNKWAKAIGQTGMPVIIHCDSGTPNKADLSTVNGHIAHFMLPSNLENIDALIQFANDNKGTQIIWAHAGLGLTIQSPGRYVDVLRKVLEAAPNVVIDLSWDVIHQYIEKDIEGWARLITEYPDRFIFGSDTIASSQNPVPNSRLNVLNSLVKTGLLAEIDKLDPSGTTKERFLSGNFDEVVDTERAKRFRTDPENAAWLERKGYEKGEPPPNIWTRNSSGGWSFGRNPEAGNSQGQ